MLWEEVDESVKAVDTGILPDLLAESVDILYQTCNLIQECRMESILGAAILMKHGDNLRKQRDTIPHLTLAKDA